MNRILFVIVSFFALLYTSCSIGDNPTDPTASDGSAEITFSVGQVGSLQKTFKTATISLNKLYISLSATDETTILDTLDLTGNHQQTIVKTYSNMASLKSWTLTAESRDLTGQIIHSGSHTFTIQPKQTEAVTLSLSAAYSMLVANFFPIRDSVTRCELLVDGTLEADSTFPKQSKLGDTVQLAYDYLAASPSGTIHTIQLDVYGEMWGFDTLLYTGDTVITVFSGEDTTYALTLLWVGPALPPPGQASITVVLGAVGTVLINGELEDITQAYPTTQITHYQTLSYEPDVSGDNIVYGHDGHIFLFDGNTTTQITSGSGIFSRPRISGSNITHLGAGEIYFYNGDTLKRLTNNSFSDYAPEISGNHVTWFGGISGRENIYYFDGSTVHQVTNDTIGDWYPQISGNNVAWLKLTVPYRGICLYNGTTITELTQGTWYGSSPDVSGSCVVWGSTNALYRFDGFSTVQINIPGNVTSIGGQQVDGENIVFQAHDGNDYEIFLYTGGNVIQISDNSIADWAPQISGTNLTWQAYNGTNYQIYAYNGSSVIQITNTGNYFNPRISGNHIVWEGNDENNIRQIYSARL